MRCSPESPTIAGAACCLTRCPRRNRWSSTEKPGRPSSRRSSAWRICFLATPVTVRQAPADQLVRAGTFLDLQIRRVGLLPRLLIDKAPPHLGSRLSIHELHRRRRSAGNFQTVPNLSEYRHHRGDLPALVSQEIFKSLRIHLIAPTLNEAVGLQMLESVAERRVGYAGRLAKLVVPAEPADKVAKYQQAPSVTDRRHDAGNRAHHSVKTLRAHEPFPRLAPAIVAEGESHYKSRTSIDWTFPPKSPSPSRFKCRKVLVLRDTHSYYKSECPAC